MSRVDLAKMNPHSHHRKRDEGAMYLCSSVGVRELIFESVEVCIRAHCHSSDFIQMGDKNDTSDRIDILVKQ